jgi:signal recognition particle subunit SRP54
MFESLTGRLGEVFDRLRKRGALTEGDVDNALREVRVALLEADVALPVVKDFIAQVRQKAVGSNVLRSVTPGQMVIKVVHDHLVETLGGDTSDLEITGTPPVPVLMVGLQGSGKTTTTAKIALRLATRERKKVLMASLDVQRPAAQEQLRQLGEQVRAQTDLVTTLPILAGQQPVDIAKRALTAARLQGFDVVMLDTAGRLHIDEGLMAEVEAVKAATNPGEVLLVADALTGQDAVNLAKSFKARTDVTGIVLTRVDGDGRGGAALSMRAVTGCPIKLLGVGEKLDALEPFHPERIAGRILGMGDVVSLVEKAAETIEAEDAERLAAKIRKNAFDLDDLRQQLRQMRKMGGLQGIMGMLPGVGQIKKQMSEAKLDEGLLKRQEAIINSMTPKERENVNLLGAKRKLRIAAGSGTSVQDVNRLLKQYIQMAQMMKKVNRMGEKGMMRGGLSNLLPRR